ncbi:mycofactocin system transcriptional regulator [Cryobacterium serini]|uniref:Mycofactocin system transcriptional regulator n=1 Tax=Cryobacterium serini TaxID=1259201 RepID=A0A4R9BJK3_9MICO|nr:mycofactocin system transcriptional regulator [Cryobacterium serini]TFD85945.1 mycofactocin system transcriptional regulator [Cryobacterium serini]
MSNINRPAPSRIGRQPLTTRAALSHVALQLFLERGFERTTVDDIASAAGIGRRTLFRYFPSKNDLPWGDFDAELIRMRAFLAATDLTVSVVDALALAVIEFNRFPSEEVPYHRERMTLLLSVPALVAHSTLRYAEWRRVVSDFAAGRLGVAVDAIEPTVIGWVFLGATLAAYEQWLRTDDSDLIELLESALVLLREGFAPGHSPTVQPGGPA